MLYIGNRNTEHTSKRTTDLIQAIHFKYNNISLFEKLQVTMTLKWVPDNKEYIPDKTIEVNYLKLT